MDNKNKFTSANWISLGIGIAIGAGLLITLIHLWPLFIVFGVGYCFHKGLPEYEDTVRQKDVK
tara:strand:- start:514 stop:702 length:189 start_codon:yes stop_codon:yes gene_type:complete